ncbi:hypothetical protein C8R44DRAFT_873742 [Mycena epipterygia]|nr:hypothetical protein C8R44DRAFT_873742 [Mycena epipterygia]
MVSDDFKIPSRYSGGNHTQAFLSVALTNALMELFTYDQQNPILPRFLDLELFTREKYFTESAMIVSVQTEAEARLFLSWRIVPTGLVIIPVSVPSVR